MGPRREHGFTLVELLIVVLIIGLLATIAIPVFNGQRKKAREAVKMTDLRMLYTAANIARLETGKTLRDITGADRSGGPCALSTDGGSRPASAPTLATADKATDPCWIAWHRAVDRIAAASGEDLSKFRDGDIDGQPFYIDENELEPDASPCSQDFIAYFAKTSNKVNFSRNLTFSNVAPQCI